jgi:hypothetical protein
MPAYGSRRNETVCTNVYGTKKGLTVAAHDTLFWKGIVLCRFQRKNYALSDLNLSSLVSRDRLQRHGFTCRTREYGSLVGRCFV